MNNINPIKLENLNDTDQEKMCDLCEGHYEGISRATCEGCRCVDAFEFLKDLKELEEENELARNKGVDQILLYGFGKMFSDQSTRVIGEITAKNALYNFKQAVRYIDKFNKIMEDGVKDPDHQKTMDIIITDLNKGVNNFRNELLGKP